MRSQAQAQAQDQNPAEAWPLVEVQAAHVFMRSEEMEPLREVALFKVSAGGKIPLKLREDQVNNRLVADLSGGETCLILGHRKPQLWSETTAGVQAGGRKMLEEKGYKVLSVGRYEKFAKLLLNVGPEDGFVYARAEGDPLEIVPLGNLAALKPGDEMECRILWRGEPLPTVVRASFDGYTAEADAYAVETASGADGVARFKLERPGLWFIRVGHIVEGEALSAVDDGPDSAPRVDPDSGNGDPAADDKCIDKWVVSATYTFELK